MKIQANGKTTLYTLGALHFQQLPFSVNAVSAGRAADWAAKDVLGTMRPREFVGIGDERLEFSGSLYPEHFADKKNSRQVLDDMRRSGTPYHLLRGDGLNMGWYIIESVAEDETFLSGRGTGKVIEYKLSLVRVPTPAAATYVKTLLRLFA